jgi:hypothetical protein
MNARMGPHASNNISVMQSFTTEHANEQLNDEFPIKGAFHDEKKPKG